MQQSFYFGDRRCVCGSIRLLSATLASIDLGSTYFRLRNSCSLNTFRKYFMPHYDPIGNLSNLFLQHAPSTAETEQVSTLSGVSGPPTTRPMLTSGVVVSLVVISLLGGCTKELDTRTIPVDGTPEAHPSLSHGGKSKALNGQNMPLVPVDPKPHLRQKSLITHFDETLKGHRFLDGNVSYLTFDDGPSPEATLKILDILDSHQSKGTFFVLGKNVLDYPEIVREMHRRGHEIALHGDQHLDLTRLSKEEIRREIANGLLALQHVLPEDTVIRWFRPPHGAYNRDVIEVTEELGLCLMRWSLFRTDATSKPEDITRDILEGKGHVVVFHDGEWPRPSSQITTQEANLIVGLENSFLQDRRLRSKTISSSLGEFCR